MSMDPTLTPAVRTALALLADGTTTLNKPNLRIAFGAITNTAAGDAIREAKARFAQLRSAATTGAITKDLAPEDSAVKAINAIATREIARVRAEEQARCHLLVQHERNATTTAREDADAQRRNANDLEGKLREVKKELRTTRSSLKRALQEVAELKTTIAKHNVLDRLMTAAGAAPAAKAGSPHDVNVVS